MPSFSPRPLPPWTSEVVIDVPDVPAKCVGGPLQRPGEKGQLASEAALLEAQARSHPGGGGPWVSRAAGAQQPHVVEQRAQRVVSAAQENVAERGVGRRHVLRQEVELHLRPERDQVGVGVPRAGRARTATPHPAWDLVRG